MRRCLTQVVFAAAMSLSLPALAQDHKSNCPPGSWFCAEAEVQVPPPPSVSVEVEAKLPPLPAPPARRLPPPPPVEVEVAPLPPPPPPPPVVIYQPTPMGPPPVRVIIVAPGYGRPVRALPPPPPPSYHRAPPRKLKLPHWGVNLRAEGIALGHSPETEGAGMYGAGLSLRYRPVPAFAFDLGVDILGGTDYNGFQRTETPVSLSGLLYVNPRSRVQFYFTGGINFSHAKVKSEFASPLLGPTRDEDGFTEEYSYFGGQGGIGLEFRLSRHVSLNVDGLGFLRHRTDDGPRPEFVEAGTGRTTKNSAGGLFRGGLTFWW
jgi:hypothetical protein